VQPGPRIVGAKTAKVFEGAQSRLLRNVLRVLAVAGEPAGQVINRIQMRQHRLFKQFQSFAVVHQNHLLLVLPIRETNFWALLFPEIISVLQGNIFVACTVWMDAAANELGVARTQINTSKL
jgi:hypothetical protein